MEPNDTKDASKIPLGPYCHGKSVNDVCPYWKAIPERPIQQDGWCDFLGKGDVELGNEGGFGLLWDARNAESTGTTTRKMTWKKIGGEYGGYDMHMSEGEVVDRYTILRMKGRLDGDARKLLGEYADEISVMLEEAVNKGIEQELVDEMLLLQEANSKIWMLEASLRKEFKDDPAAQEKLDMAEFGRRALAIREINKMRVEAKKAVDKLFGRTAEGKVEHASK